MNSRPRLTTLQPKVRTLSTAVVTALVTPDAYGQGRGGRPWRRKVEAVKLRDQYTCYVCGRLTQEGDVDHKVPLAEGGKDDESNLGWICRTPCHANKTKAEAARGSHANR